MRSSIAPVAVGVLVAALCGAAQVPAQAAAQTCAGEKATIVGTAKNDRINGTPGKDVIVGLGGDDRIDGNGGNDIICGGDGADVLLGGPGDDRLYGETDSYYADEFGQYHRKGDLLTGNGGNDTLDLGVDTRPISAEGSVVPDGVDYSNASVGLVMNFQTSPTLVTQSDTDTIVHSAAGVRVIGSAHDDQIQGSNGNDVIDGRSGNDQIWGHAGDDSLFGDTSADTAGNDVIAGGAGDDRISTRVGADTLAGESGADTITSTSTNKLVITAGTGADYVSLLVPGEADFSFKGGAGRNELRLSAFPNLALKPTLRIDQRKGKTSVAGIQPVKFLGKIRQFRKVVLPANTYTVYRGSNKGEVVDAHRDWAVKLIGRGGADVLTGSNKRDIIDGGRGFDIVYAKGGNDKCKRAERRHSC